MPHPKYPDLKSLEEQWQGFSEMVFRGMKPKPSKDSTQYKEMRKAFIAGGWSVLCALRRMGEPDIPEDEAEKYLISMEDECKEFRKKIIKEYSETN